MSIINLKNLIFLAFLMASFLFQACSQLDIVPNTTTHEDHVKDTMKDGQAKWTNIFDDDRSVSLRDMVLGDDADNFAMTVDSLTFNVILDKLSFMPLASVDSVSGIVITDWYKSPQNQNESIKIMVRFLTNEIRADGIKVNVYKKKCKTETNCESFVSDSDLNGEIKLAILKKAALIKKADLEKKN